MLRKDGDYIFYQIEEYQSKWNRWMPLIGKSYLKEYEFGEHTSCGKCWQEIGVHGIYDLDYAKTNCNELNKALSTGKIKDDIANVTQFRLVECLVSQHRSPLEYNMY